MEPLSCELWLFCSLLVFHSKQITPQLAACMPAQSQSRHSQQAQNESSESFSLMSIPPEHRLYRHVGPDGIPYMPWLWCMTCLTFKNSWRRLSAILDYVNIVEPLFYDHPQNQIGVVVKEGWSATRGLTIL